MAMLRAIPARSCTNGSALRLPGVLAALGLFLSAPTSFAAGECGVATPGGTVTCNGDGTPATDSSPYANGISYTIDGLDLEVAGAASSIQTTGASTPGVRLTGTGSNPVSIGVSSGVSIVTSGSNTVSPHGYGGIQLLQQGIGAASVVSAATVSQDSTSIGSHGISARISDAGNSGPLTATVDGDVSVAGDSNYGLYMIHAGSGPLSADVTGNLDMQGSSAIGVNVRSSRSAPDAPLVVNATGSVSGRIYASQDGLGGLRVNSRGAIDAQGPGHGVQAFIQDTDNTADIDIAMLGDDGATIVSSASNARGIYARNNGSGAINVTSSMPITTMGNRAYGIHTLQADGVGAESGVTRVRVDAPVRTGGDEAHGIYAYIYSGQSQGPITVEASAPIEAGGGDSDGILVDNFALASDARVVVAGPVSGGGGDGYGIRTVTGGTAVVDLQAGASVSALSGNALYNDNGEAQVTVADGAAVTGAIILNGGDDTLEFAGGDFTGVSLFAGGAASDVLGFTGSSGLLRGEAVVDWEQVLIDNGSAIRFDGDDTLVTEQLQLGSGGELRLRDGANDERLLVSGNFEGSGGMLTMDREVDDGSGAGDLLTIGGDTGGSTTLVVNNVGGAGAATTGDGILMIEVRGESAPDAFTMEPFMAGGYEYSLVQVGSDWYLQSHLADPVDPVDPVGPVGPVDPVDPGKGTGVSAKPVPTLGHWALVMLCVLVMALGARRRQIHPL